MWAPLVAALLVFAQFGETPQEIASKAGRVGIQLNKTGGNIVVSEVSAGSSAESAGLKVGDQILRIDVENVMGKSQSSASADLRGVYLSNVTLTVLPRGSMLPRTVEVKRDVRLYDVSHTATVDSDDLKGKPPEIEDTGKPVITATVSDFSRTSGNGPEDKVRAAFGHSPADVATCVGATADVLPNNIDRIGATFTIKNNGTTAVKTDPPSGDLSSCLGRKSANWKIPKPGKDPTVVQVYWTIQRK
ncbi:MAG TPA: PDZ domain-containing protein [bacterium]|nr:PDZ domain-containing protein [bacterium]